MTLFKDLVYVLNDFRSDDPLVTEALLEKKIVGYLEGLKFLVTSQVSRNKDRYDVICKRWDETVCVELKIRTGTSDLSQFDRYLPKFKDGLIIVCWQASFSLRDIFAEVKKQSPTPLELIELSRMYEIA